MSTSNHKAMQTKIGTLNLCLGLSNKKDLVKKMIIDEKIDILCLQETELEINVDQNLMSFNGFFMNQKITTFVRESAATSMLIFLT